MKAARRRSDVQRRFGVGRAQIERTRRRRGRIDRSAEPRHPIDVGRGQGIDLDRRRCLGRPALGENCRGIADEMRRTEAGCFERLCNRRDARPDQRTAVAADDLEIDLAVPRIDRRDHRRLTAFADDGRRIGRQRGDADRRLASRERNAARRRQADAKTGEAAGPGGDGNAIERGKRQRRLLHDARDQRHQRLGVAALHRLRFHRDQPVGAGVEHGGGAGVERGIDGEDQHRRQISIARREKCAMLRLRG